MVQQGGLSVLVGCLRTEETNIKEHALVIFRNLSGNPDINVKIVQADVLKPLIQLTGSQNLNLQEQAAIVVQNVVPALVKLLKSRFPALQARSAVIIRNIAVNPGNKKVMSQAGVWPALIQLLTSNDAVVQEHAAVALRVLTESSENLPAVISSGGIPGLIRLLSQSLPKVQMQAALCLRNLSLHPSADVEIVERGALGPLMYMLYASDADLELQGAAMSVLRKLCAHPDNKLKMFELFQSADQGKWQTRVIEKLLSEPAGCQAADEITTPKAKSSAKAAATASTPVTDMDTAAAVQQLFTLTPAVAASQGATPKAKSSAKAAATASYIYIYIYSKCVFKRGRKRD